jgi:hypothetical protein
VVDVYDADFSGAWPCVVMEYVAGHTLRQWLSRRRGAHARRPAPTIIVSIVRQMCEALRVAHERGIVHRDIKPENVLLSGGDEDCRVKVADFGLARHVDTPNVELMGTPGYIAPEQLNGAAPDRRADIFSVGVVLYEMFLGHHPFEGTNHVDTLANTLTRDPAFDGDAGPPLRYRDIIRKALQRKPSDRYASVAELLEDLTESEAEPNGYETENPFLSEFPMPVRAWLQRHSWGLPVALLSFIWGCVSITLSLVTGAACMRVSWAAEDGRTFEMMYGYLIEPNAGPWYAVGASLCVIAGFFFLHAAHMGLARTSGLTAIGQPTSVSALQHVAGINRRYFRVITPALLVGAIPFVLVAEVVFRHSNAFGWVQADLPGQFVGVHESTLVQEGKTTPLDTIHQRCPGCELRVERVSNRADGFYPPSRPWFILFLTWALTHEILFSAFLWFIAAKLIFFFWLLSRALLGSHNDGVRLAPDLEDRHDARFGLGRLDNVYFATLVFLLICAVGQLCQLIANIHKGTNFFRGNAAVALVGQPLVVSAMTVLVVIVVLVPLGVFALLTIRVVERERARLAAMQRQLQVRLLDAPFPEARARIAIDIQDLQDRRRVIDQQRLLPTGRPIFWWLLGTIVALLVLAPPVIASSVGWELVQAMNERICAACGNARSSDNNRRPAQRRAELVQNQCRAYGDIRGVAARR